MECGGGACVEEGVRVRSLRFGGMGFSGVWGLQGDLTGFHLEQWTSIRCLGFACGESVPLSSCETQTDTETRERHRDKRENHSMLGSTGTKKIPRRYRAED